MSHIEVFMKRFKPSKFNLTHLDAWVAVAHLMKCVKACTFVRFILPSHRTVKNSLPIIAGFKQRERGTISPMKNAVEHAECWRSIENYIVSVYLCAQVSVCIRGVWEQTLLILTYCSWPWGCLYSSLSDAAFLAQGQLKALMTPLISLSPTPPPTFRCSSYEHYAEWFYQTEQLHRLTKSI